MLGSTPFWFKRQTVPVVAAQRYITPVQVQTPGTAVTANIIALFNLDDSRANLDPNTLGLYGTWTGTPAVYGSHIGILSDTGFNKYLDNTGIQKNDWGAGTLDTYYNADGITFSWIQRVNPASGARLLQYWQADLEYIELYFLDIDTLRLSVILGTGTLQSVDVELSAILINDTRFHHFLVSFHPTTGRIARLYVDGTLAGSTAAVSGAAVFGAEAVNIRRGIGFGCSYSAPDTDASGDIDHATILKGIFTPIAPTLDFRMMYGSLFMKYYGDQMYYNLSAVPPPGDAFYGAEAAFYGILPGQYPSSVFVFQSGVPHWTAYD